MTFYNAKKPTRVHCEYECAHMLARFGSVSGKKEALTKRSNDERRSTCRQVSPLNQPTANLPVGVVRDSVSFSTWLAHAARTESESAARFAVSCSRPRASSKPRVSRGQITLVALRTVNTPAIVCFIKVFTKTQDLLKLVAFE